MNIIEEIIERLKKEHRGNESWKVLESYYNYYKLKKSVENFNKISAFLFGLEATDFITKEENEKATLHLIKEID